MLESSAIFTPRQFSLFWLLIKDGIFKASYRIDESIFQYLKILFRRCLLRDFYGTNRERENPPSTNIKVVLLLSLQF